MRGIRVSGFPAVVLPSEHVWFSGSGSLRRPAAPPLRSGRALGSLVEASRACATGSPVIDEAHDCDAVASAAGDERLNRLIVNEIRDASTRAQVAEQLKPLIRILHTKPHRRPRIIDGRALLHITPWRYLRTSAERGGSLWGVFGKVERPNWQVSRPTPERSGSSLTIPAHLARRAWRLHPAAHYPMHSQRRPARATPNQPRRAGHCESG
jgi:hypothetical protein